MKIGESVDPDSTVVGIPLPIWEEAIRATDLDMEA
jgi:hypothetical protein